MKLTSALALASLGLLLRSSTVLATERSFTYTYEPETMPKGGFEYEQWVTLGTSRNAAVGQENYNRWDFRHEFEYGLSDRYQVSLYLNEDFTSFHDPLVHRDTADLSFDGVSIENKYLVWNPADHAVGLSLYLEPRFSEKEIELEQKIILGQRYGDWKWALNLTHATEWAERFKETEGEVELSFGIARQLTPRWSVGIELRDHNELPEYSKWENSAFYLGPVISYRRNRWWAALTVMPQIFGANFADNPDHIHTLDLEGHERWNVRLIFGISL